MEEMVYMLQKPKTLRLDCRRNLFHPSFFSFWVLGRLEVRRIENQSHQHTTERARDRNRREPSDDEQADPLKVDGLERAVAQTDTDCRTGNTHRGRHGQRELTEKQHGDRGTHLH